MNFGFRISDFELTTRPPGSPVSDPPPGKSDFGFSVDEVAAFLKRDLDKFEIRNPKSEIGIG